jgi:hypothetical protein
MFDIFVLLPSPSHKPPKFKKTGDPTMFVFTCSVFLESFMRFGEKKLREKRKKKTRCILIASAGDLERPGRPVGIRIR